MHHAQKGYRDFKEILRMLIEIFLLSWVLEY